MTKMTGPSVSVIWVPLHLGMNYYLLSVHRFEVLYVKFQLLCLLSLLPVHLKHGLVLATHFLH